MDPGARGARRDHRDFNNRSYTILNLELRRVGAESPGPKALDMLDLSHPDLDFVPRRRHGGAGGRGRPPPTSSSPRSTAGLAEPGPVLIDAVCRPGSSRYGLKDQRVGEPVKSSSVRLNTHDGTTRKVAFTAGSRKSAP